MRPLFFAVLVALVALVCRGRLNLETVGLPLSSDDATTVLMAREVSLQRPFLGWWDQPYGGALDAWVMAVPARLVPAKPLWRLYQAMCGLLLALGTGMLGWQVGGRRAGWWAALLAGAGPPYLVLMGALGPAPYNLSPLLLVAVVLGGFAALDQELSGRIVFAAGVTLGLASWNTPLVLPCALGAATGLLPLAAERRATTGSRYITRAAAAFAGFAVGVIPMVVAEVVGAADVAQATALRDMWPWRSIFTDLWHAAAGLLGFAPPLVIDAAPRLEVSRPATTVLALSLSCLVLIGAWCRRAFPLIGWAVAAVLTFVAGARSTGDSVRYLLLMAPPIVALCGVGLARIGARSLTVAAIAGLGVLVPWAQADQALARAWAARGEARNIWGVPPVMPVVAALETLDVHSAYASTKFAARLTLESERRVLASPAWNERFPGEPLRFRDEVDLDPRAVWALSEQISRGMPRAPRFQEILRDLGGYGVEGRTGVLRIFHSFEPPFDESRPVPTEDLRVSSDDTLEQPAVLDHDARTVWTQTPLRPGTHVTVTVAQPRRLSALVLVVALEPTPLGIPWTCELDGREVARGPAPYGMQWVNGAPRAGRQALLSIPLGGRVASRVRLTFHAHAPALTVGEVFLYGPDEERLVRSGAVDEQRALERAREGDWLGATAAYAEAARREPHRASLYAGFMRAGWRAARGFADGRSLGDGGPHVLGLPQRARLTRTTWTRTMESTLPSGAGAPGLAWLYGAGWADSEGSFRWSDGREAALSFAASPGRGAILDLVLQPFLRPPELMRQRIRLTLNGVSIGGVRLQRAAVERYAVPLPMSVVRAQNMLQMQLRDACTPAFFQPGDDPRQLAIALYAVNLRPFPILSGTLGLGEAAAEPYLGRGWSFGEHERRWTEGPLAEVFFALERPHDSTVEVEFEPFAPSHHRQHVTVQLNGRLVARMKLDEGVRRLVLPGSLLEGENILDFVLPRAASPHDLGRGSDKRQLGIAVHRLVVSQASPEAAGREGVGLRPTGAHGSWGRRQARRRISRSPARAPPAGRDRRRS